MSSRLTSCVYISDCHIICRPESHKGMKMTGFCFCQHSPFVFLFYSVFTLFQLAWDKSDSRPWGAVVPKEVSIMLGALRSRGAVYTDSKGWLEEGGPWDRLWESGAAPHFQFASCALCLWLKSWPFSSLLLPLYLAAILPHITDPMEL